MGKNELKWNLEARINEKFNGMFSLSFENRLKNNTKKSCVMVHKKGCKYSPVVLFDTIVDMYNSCSSVDDIIDYLVNLTISNPFGDVDPSINKDPSKLRLVLISTENNIEYLNMVPHVGVPNTDLVAILKYDISEDYMGTITNQIIEREPNCDPKKLFEIAFQNLNRQTILFKNMMEFLKEIVPDLDDVYVEDSSLYILKNGSVPNYGAAILLKADCLNYVWRAVGNFYILPSSVHEVLILPKYANQKADPSGLITMVRDINESQVDPEDRLSNNIYEYDGTTLHMITEDDIYEEN